MIGSSNLLIRLNQSSAAQVTVMLPNQCLVTGSPMAHRAGNQLIDAECNEALRDSPSYFFHPSICSTASHQEGRGDAEADPG